MIPSSSTFDVGSSRLNNALAEAKSLVESLPGSLRTKAIQNLEQGNFTANTVGSGSVRNSVPVRFSAVNLVEVMMKFDPTRNRQNKLKEDGSLLRYLLEQQYDQNKPMGNIAQYHLSDVISYWLAGLHAEIKPIIHRSNLWLDKAILSDEKFGGNHDFHRTLLHWARAIGTWLEDAANDEGHWDQARVYEEAAWRFEGRPWPRNEIIKSGLDDYMAFAYQGGEHNDGFEAGIDMYEYWVGEKPLSLKKILKPREFGYALCLHRARGQFDADELFEAGRRMLQSNLEQTWLGSGQYLCAATWLKIVYWDRDQALSPLETILKAYDNMPNVPRPDFI